MTAQETYQEPSSKMSTPSTHYQAPTLPVRHYARCQ